MSTNIVSAKQARRLIIKMVESGRIGDSDFDFINTFAKELGTTLSPEQMRYVRDAIDTEEKARRIYVVRDESVGTIISIDKYDCSRALPSQKALGNTALLPIMHSMLVEMSNDDGLIITHAPTSDLINRIVRKLSSEYLVEYDQALDVFNAMYQLKMRGDAAKLRKSGMEVYADYDYQAADAIQAELYEQQTVARDLEDRLEEVRTQRDGLLERVETLGREKSLLSEENADIMQQNADLTAENERLEQSVNDLRKRSAKLSRIEVQLRELLDDTDKN